MLFAYPGSACHPYVDRPSFQVYAVQAVQNDKGAAVKATPYLFQATVSWQSIYFLAFLRLFLAYCCLLYLFLVYFRITRKIRPENTRKIRI